jgi:hypothetical protein
VAAIVLSQSALARSRLRTATPAIAAHPWAAAQAARTLRAVSAIDRMPATFYPLEPTALGRAASRIVNEVRGINRVFYDVTG